MSVRLIRRARYGGLIVAAAAVPAVAVAAGTVKPKTGRYTSVCPQGFHQICGEAAWSVVAKGTQIAKGSTIPWPNDPKKPSIGICGRGNPYALKAIPIKNGRFSFSGKVRGQTVTWTGQWTTARKMKGTVKWAGCKTLVTYKAST
jgi:hypothetical protein